MIILFPQPGESTTIFRIAPWDDRPLEGDEVIATEPFAAYECGTGQSRCTSDWPCRLQFGETEKYDTSRAEA